ncbi:MAG: phospholipid carrier-dependent glycosyltransferase [Phormidesmis sp.]
MASPLIAYEIEMEGSSGVRAADSVPASSNPATDWTNTLGVAHVGRWLLGLFAIAFFIRITNLTVKPAWMDEVSTVMFSLGNYSRLIPTDQLITLDQITRALQLTPGTTAMDAATNLLAENNHPPAYFMLAHSWMSFYHWVTGQTAEGTYASLWASRALPSFLGAVAVPVAYWLGWVSFRDRLAGLLCAVLMAFSPFSVFLSQEARHYTLAILLIMGSLGCFVLAVQAVVQSRPIRWLTVWMWVLINGLGIAVHYFCGIAYFAEALVLLGLLIQQCLKDPTAWRRSPWIRIYVAAAGTAAGILVWFPVLLHFYGSPQTTYITSISRDFNFWVKPLGQSLVGWLYALMSPISRGFTWQWVVVIVVMSVFMVLCYAPWLVFHLGRSLKFQWAQSQDRSLFRSGVFALGGFFVVSNLIYLAICYIVGFDITRGHRYTFAYYPSIIMLAGAGLAPYLASTTKSVSLPFLKRSLSGRMFVATVLLVAFFGSQTIVFNRTHLKFYMPDRFVDTMQAKSEYPIVLTMQSVVGDQPSVIGNEIVSAAWEIQRQLAKTTSEWAGDPKFVLVELNVVTQNDPVETLKSALEPAPRPFDLWQLSGRPDLSSIGCSEPEKGNEGSFSYGHYVCR